MYRTIDTAFWTDPKMRKLDKDGKLLCLYLVTNSHGHVGGIYYIPDEIITLETGIKKETLNTLWHTLSSVGFSRRDQEIGVVWVIKMFFYQGRGEKNQRAVANHLENLHNSFLVKEFCNAYPVVNQFRKDRVSIGYPAQGQTRTPDQDQEQDQDTPIVPKGTDGTTIAFKRLQDRWNATPGVIQCRSSTDARLKKLKTRMSTPHWADNVKPALEAITNSSFCRGENKQGWVIDIDFFLKPDTVTKLVEGAYQSTNGTLQTATDIPDDYAN